MSRGYSAALLALVAGASPAVAQVYEGFNYAPGAPLTAVGNGGTGWSNIWNLAGGGNWTVDSIGSTYSSGGKVLATSGKRIIAASAATQRTMSIGTLGAPGTTAWVSFIAQQTSGPSALSWTGVKLPCTGPNAFLFVGKPYNKPNWGTDAGSIASHLQSIYPATGKAFIVARIDFKAGADDVHVWVNPGLNSTPLNALAAVSAPAYGDFSGITKVVTEVGSQGGLITSNIDEIRVGDTFAQVAPKRPGFLWGGVMNAELGQAMLAPQADGTLMVSNLGSTGNDGVRMELGAVPHASLTCDLGPANANGLLRSLTSTVKSATGVVLSRETVQELGGGGFEVNADYSEGGATGVSYILRNSAGGVMAQGVVGTPHVRYETGPFCGPGYHAVYSTGWCGTGYNPPWNPPAVFIRCDPDVVVSGPWGTLNAATLELIPIVAGPQTPIASVEVTGMNIPELSLKQFSLRDRNITNTARREAILENTSPDMISVTNIGGTGQDGVELSAPGSSQISCAFAPSQCLSDGGSDKWIEVLSSMKMSDGTIKTLRCKAEPASPTRMKLTFDASDLGDSLMTVSGTSGGVPTGGGSGNPQSIIIYIDGILWGEYDHIPFWVWYFLRTTIENPTGNGGGGITIDNNGALSTFQADSLSIDFGGVEQPVSIESVQILGSNWVRELTISGQDAVKGCPGDFNHDGFIDFFDIDAYVSAFETGDPSGDFNGDGFIDFFDIDAFTQAFEAGC